MYFFAYFLFKNSFRISSEVRVKLSPQRGCLEIHPLDCSRSVPLHPPVASISTTTTKPVLKSIFPNCLATRIIIVVRVACSKTTPNPYRNILYYAIYYMYYICYGYGLRVVAMNFWSYKNRECVCVPFSIRLNTIRKSTENGRAALEDGPLHNMPRM